MSSDYWYDHRDELEPEMCFRMYDDSTIKLDRRVPGDGTQWYVAILYKFGWCYEDTRIEPGDLAERIFI